MILVVSQKTAFASGDRRSRAEEWTVICRISVKSFMFPLLLLQVLSIAVQVKVSPSVFLHWLSPRVSESVYDLHSISSFLLSLSLFTDFLPRCCHQTAWRYRPRRRDEEASC